MTKEIIGSGIEHVGNMTLVSRAVQNPFWLALVIVVIMMLVVLFVFRNAETDESQLRMVTRAGFYLFIASSALLFLHDKNLIEDMSKTFKDKRESAIFADIDKIGDGTRSTDEMIPVPVEIISPVWN